MVHCCVTGCKNRSERQYENITFHSFPKDPKIQKLWIEWTGKESWVPTKNTRMCSRHFEPQCFRKSQNNSYLYANSVPTLYAHVHNPVDNPSLSTNIKTMDCKKGSVYNPAEKPSTSTNIDVTDMERISSPDYETLINTSELLIPREKCTLQKLITQLKLKTFLAERRKKKIAALISKSRRLQQKNEEQLAVIEKLKHLSNQEAAALLSSVTDDTDSWKPSKKDVQKRKDSKIKESKVHIEHSYAHPFLALKEQAQKWKASQIKKTKGLLISIDRGHLVLGLEEDAQKRKASQIKETKDHIDRSHSYPVLGLKDSAKSSKQQCKPELESFPPINDDGDHENIFNDGDDYQDIEHVVKDKSILFSWQNDEGVKVPADDEEILNDSTDQDKFYDDGVTKSEQTEEKTGTEQAVPKDDVFRAYQCNNCKELIDGFLYKCVECFDYDLCSACEAQGVHPLHYVLRIPQSRHNDEIRLAIEIIQRELNLSFSKRGAVDDTDSVKLEIKEETDPIYTEEVCVGDISICKEEVDFLDASYGQKDTMQSGETITGSLDDEMVVEMLEDEDDMVVERLDDDEETLSAPTYSGNSEESDEDDRTSRTILSFTRDTNKTRRTVGTDPYRYHSENSYAFSSDDDHDDYDFRIPKRKKTTLRYGNPNTGTKRPVDTPSHLRQSQADGKKKTSVQFNERSANEI